MSSKIFPYARTVFPICSCHSLIPVGVSRELTHSALSPPVARMLWTVVHSAAASNPRSKVIVSPSSSTVWCSLVQVDPQIFDFDGRRDCT